MLPCQMKGVIQKKLSFSLSPVRNGMKVSFYVRSFGFCSWDASVFGFCSWDASGFVPACPAYYSFVLYVRVNVKAHPKKY